MKASVSLLVALAACSAPVAQLTSRIPPGDSGFPEAPPMDAGGVDAGRADAGLPQDDEDGGDGGSTDAGSDGGNTIDAGTIDAGPTVDAGSDGDAGSTDAGQPVVTYTSNTYFGLASADLNGDGMLDLVAGLFAIDGTGFDIFMGQPDGGLTFSLHLEGADGYAIALGDLSSDGRPDIVVSNGQSVNVFLQLPDGGYAEPTLYAAAGDVSVVGIGDFDGDGLLDLAIGDYLGVEWRRNLGGGTFGAASSLPGQTDFWGGLAVADFNQDGLADIAVGSSSEGGLGLLVLLSQGDGGFSVSNTSFVLGSQMIAVPTLAGPPALAFTELGEVLVLIDVGTGTPTLGSTCPTTDSNIGEWLTAGDFNDDGIADLAASGWLNWTESDGGSAWNGGVSILFGLADGGFAAAVAAPMGFDNSLAPLGPVNHRRALAGANDWGGITIYGDPSRH